MARPRFAALRHSNFMLNAAENWTDPKLLNFPKLNFGDALRTNYKKRSEFFGLKCI